MKSRLLTVPLMLLAACAAHAADYSTPMGRVRDSIDRVVAIVQDESISRDARWQRISVIIDEGFDFRSMSQSVLATEWKRATPEEREQFIRFFSQYIAETYRSKIEAYTGQQIVYKSEVIDGDRAVVATEIVTDSTVIPVNYKLKNNDGQWYAYDVVVEGVSLVANYRSTFAAIANNEGMDGLLADIQRRIEKYKQEHPADAGPAPAGGTVQGN
ncbi:MAG: ABC transporter substrate-binding protein [Gammaproteobacteria bacterium]|nr:ABC transporter substrate-binding protein [Gammaproteobacteria bacterium]